MMECSLVRLVEKKLENKIVYYKEIVERYTQYFGQDFKDGPLPNYRI
jgi:hypothetical protein